MTNEEIIQKVRSQIAWALYQDYKGGESIMKECWEQLEGDEEFRMADDELRKIIMWLVPDFNFKDKH